MAHRGGSFGIHTIVVLTLMCSAVTNTRDGANDYVHHEEKCTMRNTNRKHMRFQYAHGAFRSRDGTVCESGQVFGRECAHAITTAAEKTKTKFTFSTPRPPNTLIHQINHFYTAIHCCRRTLPHPNRYPGWNATGHGPFQSTRRGYTDRRHSSTCFYHQRDQTASSFDHGHEIRKVECGAQRCLSSYTTQRRVPHTSPPNAC